MLTLVVPYDHIDPGSALLQMWSYVGAPKCRAIVAIGATAGLSVAMFGSMFPMPRVSRFKMSFHQKLSLNSIVLGHLRHVQRWINL